MRRMTIFAAILAALLLTQGRAASGEEGKGAGEEDSPELTELMRKRSERLRQLHEEAQDMLRRFPPSPAQSRDANAELAAGVKDSCREDWKIGLAIDDGADVNRKNEAGWSPFETAVFNCEPLTVEKFLRAGAVIDSGMAYAQTIPMIDFLLSKGADVNAKNDLGWTALMLGVTSIGGTDITQALIERGADVNVTDDFGDTPLMRASKIHAVSQCALLIERGAAVNVRNQEGKTALIFSAAAGNPEIAKLLLDHGGEFGARDNDGKSAWNYASKLDRSVERNLELMKFLALYPVRNPGYFIRHPLQLPLPHVVALLVLLLGSCLLIVIIIRRKTLLSGENRKGVILPL